MKPRIAVVGIGTVGAQALWQLSEQDCEVVGYELYAPGHSRGAAAGENRIFTRVEMEDAREVPIIARADQLFRQLEEASGVQVRDQSGTLIIAQAGSIGEQIATAYTSSDDTGYEYLSNEQLREQFPKFLVRDDEVGILDHFGGIIFPDRTIQAAASLAIENGAKLHTEHRVQRIEQEGNRVRVHAEDGSSELYDRVVVSAGPWTSQLFPELEPYFAVRRLTSAWFRPQLRQDMEGLLGYIRTEPYYSYGMPSTDGQSMKVGLGFNNHMAITSPDDSEYRLREEELVPLRELARDLFTGLEQYPNKTAVCHEGYTSSRVQWVKPHPDMDRVLILAGFSGKGFRTSPAHGEIAASWAVGSPVPDWAEFLLTERHEQFS